MLRVVSSLSVLYENSESGDSLIGTRGRENETISPSRSRPQRLSETFQIQTKADSVFYTHIPKMCIVNQIGKNGNARLESGLDTIFKFYNLHYRNTI